MADYREIIHERFYVKVPGGDSLRKTAAARQKHLLAQTPEYFQVKFERTGHAPMKARLPKKGPEIRDTRPRRRDGRGGPGGPRGPR
jgi:D-tyrosyl-tRNA(Tyr) deacylase